MNLLCSFGKHDFVYKNAETRLCIFCGIEQERIVDFNKNEKWIKVYQHSPQMIAEMFKK